MNGDAVVNAGDIDALYAAIDAGTVSSTFDLNGDQQVDSEDVGVLVEGVLGTYYGDANLNGYVDAADLNQVGVHWQASSKGWADGDFTGDGIVNAADLNVLAINWQHGVPQSTGRAPQAPLSAADPMDRDEPTSGMESIEEESARPLREPTRIWSALHCKIETQRRHDSNSASKSAGSARAFLTNPIDELFAGDFR
jgi:hypothetical protein